MKKETKDSIIIAGIVIIVIVVFVGFLVYLFDKETKEREERNNEFKEGCDYFVTTSRGINPDCYKGAFYNRISELGYNGTYCFGGRDGLYYLKCRWESKIIWEEGGY